MEFNTIITISCGLFTLSILYLFFCLMCHGISGSFSNKYAKRDHKMLSKEIPVVSIVCITTGIIWISLAVYGIITGKL